jgi:hypothetical protein
MAVANPNESTTLFELPSGIEGGYGNLEVVANGIPSYPREVFVQ